MGAKSSLNVEPNCVERLKYEISHEEFHKIAYAEFDMQQTLFIENNVKFWIHSNRTVGC